MRHARDDYNRIQDPAAHPDVHIHRFLGELADAFESENRQEAILSAVVGFFGVNPARAEQRLAVARAFAARAILGETSTAFGNDEPVFLIRGQDICAPAAIATYAEMARLAGSAEIADRAAEWADRVRAWQASPEGRIRRPDLPFEGEHRGSRAVPPPAPAASLDEDAKERVEALVLGYDPFDADGKEILSRRTIFEGGRWLARYGLQDEGEPVLVYEVFIASNGAGINDTGLDLRRVDR